MPVTIIQKLPVATSLGNLGKFGFGKSVDVIVPLSPGGDDEIEKQLTILKQAFKHEEKLFKKCQQASEGGLGSFRKATKTYLTNQRCLLVALWHDNARQRLEDRRSLAKLIALSKQFKVLKSLNEDARIWQEPKSSGNGMRVICSFGPVARASQRMVARLLLMTFEQQEFQHAQLNHTEKVQRAMSEIKMEGYEYVAEIDIRDFFPNFEEETLLKALPLPKEAIRQIVLAKGATWEKHPSPSKHEYIGSPPGIPQGSASSAAVATWCVAEMPFAKPDGVEIINHADNFFAFAASESELETASNALSSGIAGLPGGDFSGKTEQVATVVQGFRMLGCWVYEKNNGLLEAEPTETNYQRLREKAGRVRHLVHTRLGSAKAEGSGKLRMMGLQDYLRFESICISWVKAFQFCGPHLMHVAMEYAQEFASIRATYDIQNEEPHWGG